MGERVLVCGSRHWNETHNAAIYDALDLVALRRGVAVVIHGACRGVDSIAAAWVSECPSVKELAFPAEWQKHGPRAGPIRNRQMLAEGRPTLVLAFHDDLAASKGTADMVQAAKDAGIPVYHFDSLRRGRKA